MRILVQLIFKIFKLWIVYEIISFSPFLSSLKTLSLNPPQSLSNSWPLFPLVVVHLYNTLAHFYGFSCPLLPLPYVSIGTPFTCMTPPCTNFTYTENNRVCWSVCCWFILLNVMFSSSIQFSTNSIISTNKECKVFGAYIPHCLYLIIGWWAHRLLSLLLWIWPW